MSVTINGTSGLVFNDASTQNTAATGFGFKNRIINGAMRIDQRNAGASVTPTTSGTYTLDRWKVAISQASKFSVQRSSVAPTGFSNSLLATSLSSYTVGSSEAFQLVQAVEGVNFSDFSWGSASGSPATLSFWVRSSLTGTFGGSLTNGNGASTASYPFNYTINVANTWEQKSVAISCPTIGTWNTNNDTTFNLRISLGTGSTYQGTAGTWVASDRETVTGETQIVGTNGATFYITGVQLEKGSTATSFDYRPYGTELALCQRYYYRLTASGSGGFLVSGSSAVTSTLTRGLVQFPVTMRTAPTSLEQTGTASDYQVVAGGGAINCSSVPSLADATTSFLVVGSTVASGLTVGGSNYVRSNNSNVYFGFSAEL
jgi:hypothetical protein